MTRCLSGEVPWVYKRLWAFFLTKRWRCFWKFWLLWKRVESVLFCLDFVICSWACIPTSIGWEFSNKVWSFFPLSVRIQTCFHNQTWWPSWTCGNLDSPPSQYFKYRTISQFLPLTNTNCVFILFNILDRNERIYRHEGKISCDILCWYISSLTVQNIAGYVVIPNLLSIMH